MKDKSSELLKFGSNNDSPDYLEENKRKQSKIKALYTKYQQKNFNGKVLLLLTIIAISTSVSATVSILTFINASSPRNVRVVNTPDVAVINTVDANVENTVDVKGTVEVDNTVDVWVNNSVNVHGAVSTW